MVESKPEGNKPDLRISQPWPELLEYCRSIDLEKQVRIRWLCQCTGRGTAHIYSFLAILVLKLQFRVHSMVLL